MAKRPGITNRQARFLAGLQRKLGVPYTGYGLSCAEASEQIDACLRKLMYVPKPRPRRPPKAVREAYGRAIALDEAWRRAAEND